MEGKLPSCFISLGTKGNWLNKDQIKSVKFGTDKYATITCKQGEIYRVKEELVNFEERS